MYIRPHGNHISMQHHLTCPRIKCLHIHHPIIYIHTLNVCCVVVPISHVLIFQSKNQIGIIPAHLFQYVFMFITQLNVLQLIEYFQYMKGNFSFVFTRTVYCVSYKFIDKKRYFHEGGIYC